MMDGMSESIAWQTASRAGASVGVRGWRAVLTAVTVALLRALATPPRGRAQPAPATPQILVIVDGAGERRFSASELLARPDAADVSVTEDVYQHQVIYRAVPLL